MAWIKIIVFFVTEIKISLEETLNLTIPQAEILLEGWKDLRKDDGRLYN